MGQMDDPGAPDAATFHRMAEEAFKSLPVAFLKLCGDVVLHTVDLAEPEILAELEIASPMMLSGLYEGVDVLHQSVSDPAPLSAHVHLYRLPILAEWRERGDVALNELVLHVIVHEIGHHFGLSDEEMHAIEDAADN
jgi:predicted Zn-dependent protease with MMP-like domain